MQPAVQPARGELTSNGEPAADNSRGLAGDVAILDGSPEDRALTATVCKIFDFPAAHTNSHHDGHCARKHGHTWTLEVYARGEVNRDETRSDFGMVVDFGTLKDAYRAMIEPAVEHQDLDETLAHLPERTTELIASWALDQLHAVVPQVFKVRLWEGRSSFVEVEL
jgi:6-pyruvoyltetrahydropterin/6-carboxytetrahydropterin synthase